ncbi:DUF742 domain-containing protein [Catellatospora tritici]|uniref:DUF742 domain-containing protein n=1 Tax=Catellatospora tritici TaxID=2851566 RepID=UPI001C2CE650|nr:DUF742 domain-containing protein [Catellatospora tritici]MBV1850175.1 DUF742 domain-containing protein [Catellatospora tritici]
MRWLDDDAGPVVRPYAMTGGRTRPAQGDFDLIELVVATRPMLSMDAGMGTELAEIIRLCQRPQSVAEVSARLRLPAGTVRVLLADLAERRLIRRRPPVDLRHLPTQDILRAVIDGIRAL